MLDYEIPVAIQFCDINHSKNLWPRVRLQKTGGMLFAKLFLLMADDCKAQ
jgi:hypothetical protein